MAKIDLPVLPPRLYRYRNVSTMELAEQELGPVLEHYLWCSNYRALNDPMEGFYGTSPWLAKQSNFERLANEIVVRKSLVGICCFSDTYENELMWAHYTANYSGICIAYSTSELRSGLDDRVHIVRVAYDGQPPRIGRDYSNCPERAARAILSHKKAPWLYEREWRLMANSDALTTSSGNSAPPPGRLPIARTGSVKAVYLGSRIKDEVKDKLVTELSKRKIAIHAMKVSGYGHDWMRVK
ncbi:DUF2971 domain-containing protein [Ensifer sp. NBAIM29]|nr:DUF2971 domain-containing protein [Ensifer sp. NBAIM29]